MSGADRIDGQRLLILAPTGKDAALSQGVLERAGIECESCDDLSQLCDLLDDEVGALLMAEESIVGASKERLARWLKHQPAWSDLPIVILARTGADSSTVAQTMELLGNVTVLERPTRVAALVSTVRAALRARRRQYQTREHLLESVRSASALLESESRLRRLLQLNETTMASMGEGVYTVDAQGRVTSMNAEAERMFGWTETELLGQRMHDITHHSHPDGTPFPVDECSGFRVLRDGRVLKDFQDTFIRKDGTFFDVSYSSSPLRDPEGTIAGLVVVFQDVTDRRAAEREIGAKARLLDLTHDAIIVRDLGDRIVYWNRGAEQMYGWSAEEAVGRVSHDLLRTVFPEPVESILATVRKEGRWAGELVHTRRNGEQLVVESRWALDRDETGKPTNILAINNDVTERKRAEEALRESDRRKDEFLAILAHELRNPLAPIHNSLHILRLTQHHDETTGRVVEMMERQVNHMVRLVDDLLEVSRITRGKIELRKELVEVAAIVRNAVETSRPLIDAGAHRLTLSIPPEPLTVNVDPVRLAQVIANLLNNAAKYTDPGGQIRLAVQREDSSVKISVRDTGSGISPEMLPRVFDLFTQIDRHADRSQGGLGIGLTLVKSLVELHGGTVEAMSEGLGRGSEFIVRIPLTAARTFGDRSRLPVAVRSLPPHRVLVVDDNRDAAESLGILLELMGAEVEVAYSAQEALKAMRMFQPSVVLLDIGMPGIDGYEVARRIRSGSGSRHVTLIALTGWGQEEDRSRSREAGFDHHLVKPGDVNSLQTLLMSLEPESN